MSEERADRSVDSSSTVNLIEFDDKEFYIVGEGSLNEAGTFSIESTSSSGPHSIDLKPQFRGSKTSMGIVRILENGELQLCFSIQPQEKRPTSFAGFNNGQLCIMSTCKRLTDNILTNPASMRDLHDPDKRPLWQAMSEIIMAHQAGPENLRKIAGERQTAVGATKTKLNLKKIALAFNNYHDAHNKLPGTANVRPSDEDKKYPYSWRVAILPFIEENELYEQYRFDEPWGSEENLKLLEKIPEVYRSPFQVKDPKPGHTIFQGFAGEQTALGTGSGVAFKDFADGVANTILVMESCVSVPWTKPEDMPFPNPPGTKVVFPNREKILYVAADGSIHTLTQNALPDLKSLITRNGDEPANQRPSR